MIKIYYCDACYNALCACDEPMLAAFELICERYVMMKMHTMFYVQDLPYNPVAKTLASLEEMGFIISTEGGLDYIKALPRGVVFDESLDGYRVCFQEGCHE